MGATKLIDIDEFYSTIVGPFVQDFKNDRASLRNAFGAVWALDSFGSHIFYAFKHAASLNEENDIAFKSTQRKKSKDFDIIVEVSNASKHAVRNRVGSVTKSTEIISIKLEGWAAYFSGPDADKWGDQVIVHNDDHLFSPLLPKVLRTETFLREICASLAEQTSSKTLTSNLDYSHK